MSSGRTAEGTILVTGGAGYIGSALVTRLLAGGRNVRVFDPLLFGGGALSHVRDDPHFSLVVGDPTNRADVLAAVEGTARIVHLGALGGDPTCAIAPAFAVAANVESTKTLVEAATHAGVKRFVFASTCSVYGAGDHDLTESAELDPKSLYAETKLEGERIVLASGAIDPVVLRFGTAFGASRRARFDLVVNLLTARAAAGEPVSVYGGDQWRPFVHVDDIVSAVVLALDADAACVTGEVFNVGSAAENRQLREIGEIVAAVVPGAVVAVDHSSIDRRDYRADFSKIASCLGFEATWTMRAGIEDLVAELREHPIGDYRGPGYSNERWLANLMASSGGCFGFDRITAGRA